MKQNLLSTVSATALGFEPQRAFKNPDGVMRVGEKQAILIEPAPVQLLVAYIKRGWKVRVAAGMTKDEADAILFPWMTKDAEAMEVL